MCSFSIRDNTAMISSKHNILYIHTSIFDWKPNQFDILGYQTQNANLRGSQPTISDILKVTLKSDVDDIKLLAIKTLNSQINISKDQVKTLNKENHQESTDGYSQLINGDA